MKYAIEQLTAILTGVKQRALPTTLFEFEEEHLASGIEGKRGAASDKTKRTVRDSFRQLKRFVEGEGKVTNAGDYQLPKIGVRTALAVYCQLFRIGQGSKHP